MIRKVEYIGFKEQAHNIIEHCGADNFWRAIGRLSSWGIGDDCDTVAKVEISANYKECPYINPPQTEIEISASNLRDNGTLIISIHAIWSDRDRSFSFHS